MDKRREPCGRKFRPGDGHRRKWRHDHSWSNHDRKHTRDQCLRTGEWRWHYCGKCIKRWRSRPGNSLGTLQVSGNVVQLTAGTLQIEIGGIAAGSQFDQLAVSGQLTLSGALQFSLVNGFAPVTGNSSTSSFGRAYRHTFSVQLPTLATGRAWDTSRLYTTGVSSVVSTAGMASDSTMTASSTPPTMSRGVRVYR